MTKNSLDKNAVDSLRHSAVDVSFEEVDALANETNTHRDAMSKEFADQKNNQQRKASDLISDLHNEEVEDISQWQEEDSKNLGRAGADSLVATSDYVKKPDEYLVTVRAVYDLLKKEGDPIKVKGFEEREIELLNSLAYSKEVKEGITDIFQEIIGRQQLAIAAPKPKTGFKDFVKNIFGKSSKLSA